MRTERRWGLRKAVQADVLIDNQPASLLRGRINDVSVGGLYVSTIPVALAPNSGVELVFMRQVQGATRVYRLSAMVVRRGNEGVGLLINHYDLDAFRALVALLLEQTGSGSEASEHQSVSASVNTGNERRPLGLGLAGTAGTAVAAPRVEPIYHNDSPQPGDTD